MKGERTTLSAEDCFVHADSPKDLDKYPWPDVKYLDFTEVYQEIEKYQDKMVFTEIWQQMKSFLPG